MKVGVSSYSFNRYLRETKCGYERILEIAKEIGFDGVEFVGLVNPGWGEDGKPIEIARKIKQKAAELELAVPAYTIAANFLGDEPDREVDRLYSELEVAAELGVKVMRHDASFALRRERGYTWESGIAEMAPRIAKVAERAATLGIKTCTENHGYIYQDAVRVKRLIEAVGHPNFGWLIDMGNFIVCDGDPLASVKLALPYATHVHAKDFIVKRFEAGQVEPDAFARSRGGALWRGTVLGHGVVPVEACVKALAESGYDGWVSHEFEGLEDNLDALRAGYAYLRRCVDVQGL